MYSVTGPSMEELQFHIAGLNEITSESDFVLFGPGLAEWLSTGSITKEVFLSRSVPQETEDGLSNRDILAELVRGRFWKHSREECLRFFTDKLHTYLIQNVEGLKIEFVYEKRGLTETQHIFTRIRGILSQEPFAHFGVFLQSGSVNTIYETIPGGIEACKLQQLQLNPMFSSMRKLTALFGVSANRHISEIVASKNYLLAAGWEWKHQAQKVAVDKMQALMESKKKIAPKNKEEATEDIISLWRENAVDEISPIKPGSNKVRWVEKSKKHPDTLRYGGMLEKQLEMEKSKKYKKAQRSPIKVTLDAFEVPTHTYEAQPHHQDPPPPAAPPNWDEAFVHFVEKDVPLAAREDTYIHELDKATLDKANMIAREFEERAYKFKVPPVMEEAKARAEMLAKVHSKRISPNKINWEAVYRQVPDAYKHLPDMQNLPYPVLDEEDEEDI